MNQGNTRCSKCGFLLNEGDKFCRNCGAQVDNQETPSADNNVPGDNHDLKQNRPNFREDNSKKPNKNVSWKYTLYGIIILVLIFAGVYFIKNMDDILAGNYPWNNTTKENDTTENENSNDSTDNENYDDSTNNEYDDTDYNENYDDSTDDETWYNGATEDESYDDENYDE